MTVLLDPPARRWECPNCPVTDLTPAHVTNRFHACRGLKGLSAPLVPAGADCQVRAVEREDYVRGELVQTDGDGRPVMAIVPERADGSNDMVVLAPTARYRSEA